MGFGGIPDFKAQDSGLHVILDETTCARVCMQRKQLLQICKKQLVAQEVKFSVWNIIIPRLTKCEPLVRNAECPRAQW